MSSCCGISYVVSNLRFPLLSPVVVYHPSSKAAELCMRDTNLETISTMDLIALVSIFFHTTCSSLGILFNLTLLYLVIYRTPNIIEVYAVLIGNYAFTDLLACLASLLTQQRVIPVHTGLVYLSHGPCKLIGEGFCFIIYDLLLSCYTHSLYSLLCSFFFRYYILSCNQPSAVSLKLIIAVIAIPSLFQFAILIPANQPREELLPMLARELPQYTFVGETTTGHTDVFEWKVCTAILHMTLPVTPVYIGILLLRRRIMAMLSVNAMSEGTKKLHNQLLRALTYQAMLPCVFFMGVLSYAVGQLGICQNAILETLTFSCFATLPVLSPLMSLYFIGPYRRIISMCLLGAVSKVFPSKCIRPIHTVQYSSTSASLAAP